MHKKLIWMCTAVAVIALSSCESTQSVKPSPANQFLGRSVEDRAAAYAGKDVPPIIEAIWQHDAEAITALVAKGADPNLGLNNGKDDTPLLEAIEVGPDDLNLDVVKALLAAKKIDVNKFGSLNLGAYRWNRTPLISAAGHGYIEVVKLLVERGAKVDTPDNYSPDQTLFGTGPLNTALIYASENGYPDVVTYLLDKGAKVDYQNAMGETALILASSKGHDKSEKKVDIAKAIEVLLNRGSKPDTLAIPAKPKYQKIDLPAGTPASVNSNLLLNGTGASALDLAANTGFMEAAKLLLDKGAKIELPCYGNKVTALTFATQTRQNEMISFLLDRGANIEAADTVGTTPLIMCAMGLYYDTAQLLLKRGANVNAVSSFNTLIYATNVGRPDKEGESIAMMKLFLDAGVNLDYQAADGSTALMAACGWGVVSSNPARAQLLIDKGAKLDLQNKKGDTALMLVAYRGYVDIASLLISKGANVNLKNADGRTALMTASAAILDLQGDNGDYDHLVKLLLDKGADVNVMDKAKANALSLATLYERDQTIALLKAKGAKLDGTAKPADPPVVGTWEGIKNSNPYATYRFVFNSDKTWSSTVSASAAFKKEYPDQFDGMNEQLKAQASMEGTAGTYAFREQFLLLKTDSAFSPTKVYQVSFEDGKLHLNGTELILTKVKK